MTIETGTVEAATALRLSDVGFDYPDGTVVLRGTCTSVRSGDVVGIVGPSGCGKSTLLHLVAGLIHPTSGTIDRQAAGDRSSRHQLAMVFQGDTLLPWLTVRENVALYSRFRTHGMPNSSAVRRISRSLLRRSASRTDLDDRVDALLELVGMADRAAFYPYQLSGGMRRRVAFITAVASQPQILLLDEPFSAVDEPSRIAIHQDVYEILRLLGITAVLVTHDLAEAVTLCDRILIMGKRPAGIVDEYEISFGRSRDMLAIRAGDDYLQAYGKLWSRLSDEIRAGSDGAQP